MLNAIIKEISLRKEYLEGQIVETIYFGGGTPSLLSGTELKLILDTIGSQYSLSAHPEITLEANPDDLDLPKLTALKLIGINRLSIGVQSFFDEDLQWMNRAHNAHEARNCIEQAHRVGFDNISMDLIFGSPTTSNEMWQENLSIASDLNIPHFSCYALTVEPRTALYDMIKKGKTPAPPDARIHEQFYITHEHLTQRGYEHYEISNYGKEGSFSKHNTSYWQGKTYLGIGPAAHSFNRLSRSWNIAHNIKYIETLKSGELPIQSEILSATDKFNEYLMTGLRTMWGCEKNRLDELLPQGNDEFQENMALAIDKGHICNNDNTYVLDKDVMVIADSVIGDLFLLDN